LVTRLIEQNAQLESELRPFTEEELTRIKIDYARRCNASSQCTQLPNGSSTVKFVDVQFDDPVSFEGFFFPDCSFEHTVFSRGVHARFNNATFMRLVSFKNANFYDEEHFNSINLLAGRFSSAPDPEMDFSGATFHRQAFFEHAKFAGKVLFTNRVTFGSVAAIDSDGIWFRGARFSRDSDFTGAIFNYPASFDKTFFQWPKFNSTTFMRDVWFDDAVFSGETHFGNTIFKKSSSFVNAKMNGETSFEGATFEREPPRFLGAKLHQGTVWPNPKQLPKPKNAEEAGRFIDAYACLKLEMDRLKKHEDELDFFALELQSGRVELSPSGWGLPIWLYGLFSGYGRSYWRPLVALFYLALIGTLAFLTSNSLSAGQSPGLSWANTFNVFGFRKDFFDPKVIADLPGWLDVVGAVQTILGTVLLFLIGLGIRNKFRMK
jgi:uncharacterized protein YjbI with pentapeptide repeats